MHPDDDALHALTDGELPAGATTDIEMHLEQCADCAERLAALRSLTAATFRSMMALDADEPALQFADIVEKAHPRFGAPRVRQWAAVAVVALTLSGLAIAAPRSPLLAWVRSLVSARANESAPVVHSAPARVSVPSRDTVHDRAGVTVYPRDSLRIDFSHWQIAGAMTIALIDSAPVSVRTDVGAAAFSTSATTLRIDNTHSASSFDFLVPRRAVWIEIRVAGRRVYLRSGRSDRVGAEQDSGVVKRISLVLNAAASQTRR